MFRGIVCGSAGEVVDTAAGLIVYVTVVVRVELLSKV